MKVNSSFCTMPSRWHFNDSCFLSGHCFVKLAMWPMSPLLRQGVPYFLVYLKCYTCLCLPHLHRDSVFGAPQLPNFRYLLTSIAGYFLVVCAKRFTIHLVTISSSSMKPATCRPVIVVNCKWVSSTKTSAA